MRPKATEKGLLLKAKLTLKLALDVASISSGLHY